MNKKNDSQSFPQITFLGTGGGRHVIANQTRQTGGFVIFTETHQIVCDPGPGHIVHATQNKISPKDTDIIFISHEHIDHCNDFAVLIDAITEGKRYKKGVFIAPKNVHTHTIHPFYHDAGKLLIHPEENDFWKTKDIHFTFYALDHPGGAYGFMLHTKQATIGYIADTNYFPTLSDSFSGADCLIINMTSPHTNRFPGHLNTDDTLSILTAMNKKPKTLFITHRGLEMSDEIATKEARYIKQKTGIKTIIARDNHTFDCIKDTWQTTD